VALRLLNHQAERPQELYRIVRPTWEVEVAMARKDAVVKLTMMAVKIAGRVLATGATPWVRAGFLYLVPCAVLLFR
jgi:hypothetical protein